MPPLSGVVLHPPLAGCAPWRHDNRNASPGGTVGRCGLGRRVPAAVLLCALLAGCAAAPQPPDPADGPEAACRAFFHDLDAATNEAGVRDGIGPPADDFPYLRSTRFLQSFVPELDDRYVRTAWLDAAQATDRQARRLELSHLDEGRVREIRLPEEAGNADEAIRTCSERLRKADALDAEEGPWPRAAKALEVGDDYITWHRAAGVYPVSRWFIRSGVAVWQRGVRSSFENHRPEEAPALQYGPGHGSPDLDAARQLVAAAPLNALGWPDMPGGDWRRLFEHYAPVLEAEADAPYNRLGRPNLDADGLPVVDTADPVVYTHASGVRYGDETLIQLNYTWWFTERPLDHWLDLLGGRLDGLTLRLTLDRNGELLLVESMHNCGCYHQHYPVNGLAVKDSPDYAEPPLVLPGPGQPRAGERLHVRLEDGSHYVSHMAFAEDDANGRRYVFDDYDSLRSVPVENGRRRSLFQPDGLVTGTERSERWFFWVSGVPEPGAMRQYHRHPTAFMGRRHFDDPDLLERIYRREQ